MISFTDQSSANSGLTLSQGHQKISIQFSQELAKLMYSSDVSQIFSFICSQNDDLQLTVEVQQSLSEVYDQLQIYSVNFSYLFSNLVPYKISRVQEIQFWKRLIILTHFSVAFRNQLVTQEQFSALGQIKTIHLHISNIFDGGFLQPVKLLKPYQKESIAVDLDFVTLFLGIIGNFQQTLAVLQYVKIQFQISLNHINIDQEEQQCVQFIEDQFNFLTVKLQSDSYQRLLNQLSCQSSLVDLTYLFDQLCFQKMFLNETELLSIKQKLFNYYILIKSNNISQQHLEIIERMLIMFEFPLFLSSSFSFQQIDNFDSDVYIGLYTKAKKLRIKWLGRIENKQESDCLYFLKVPKAYEKVNIIFFRSRQQINQNNICLVDCSKSLQITLPKTLFLWIRNDKQIIYLQYLFSHNISKYIDRITPGILCDSQNVDQCSGQVNSVIQGLREKQIDVLVDFDFHLIIGDKDAGNLKYAPHYCKITSPVMIQNSLVDMQIPDVKIMKNFITQGQIKRMMLNYSSFEVISLALTEIGSLIFKYQVQGIFLNGFEQIDQFVVEYIDKMLAIMFPQTYFYAVLTKFKLPLQLIKIIPVGDVDNQMYIYNNSLKDVLLFQQIVSKPIIFSLQCLRNTIDTRNLVTLIEQSKFQHRIYQCTKFVPKLNDNFQIVSQKNYFEQMLFECSKGNIKLKSSNNFMLQENVSFFHFIYEQFSRILFINIGNMFSLNSLQTNEVTLIYHNFYQPNDIVYISNHPSHFIVQEGKFVYVFDTESPSDLLVEPFTKYPLVWSYFCDTFMCDVQAYSIQVFDLVPKLINYQNKSIFDVYRVITADSQQNSLLCSFELFNTVIGRHGKSIEILFQLFFKSVYGMYLYIFDQISVKKLNIPSQFASSPWKPFILDRQQFLDFYPLHLLLKLLQVPTFNFVFLELDYQLCIEILRKSIQIAYPLFVQQINGIHNYKPIVSTGFKEQFSFQDIRQQKFSCDVLILFSRMSVRLANICSQLAFQGLSVLGIGPLFETPSEIESLPEQIIGKCVYTYQNWFDNYTCKDYGIHQSYSKGCQFIFLHNFEIFKDLNLFGAIKQQTSGQSMHDFVHSPMFYSHSAEVLLQRSSAISGFVLQTYQKFQAPKVVLSTGSFSSIALLTIEKHFSQQIQVMHERQQIPLTFKPPKYLQLLENNCRDIFECKNDIVGYQISNFGYIQWLLSQLQINQQSVLDQFYENKLFSLRGSIQLVQKIFTSQQIDVLLRDMSHYNWALQNKIIIIDQSFLGILKIVIDILDTLK